MPRLAGRFTFAALILLFATASAGQPPVAPGFYRYSNDKQVYRVTARAICAVVGPGQLRSLGGEGRVRPVPRRVDLFAGRRNLGACAWPDGFYRYARQRPVYLIRGREICTVVGEGQLAVLGGAGRVQTVGARARLATRKKDTGACAWPDGFYRYPQRAQVYRIRGGTICSVVGEGQLRALGGAGRVRTVGANAGLSRHRRDIGSCPWPNGFYRPAGRPDVYRITGNRICAVRDPAQLRRLGGQGRVQNVGPNPHLRAGKRYTGVCR